MIDWNSETQITEDMMTKGEIARRGPYEVKVRAGKNYAWCSCGRSESQPLCDGSHRGTEFLPHVFRAKDNDTLAFCGCKQTNGVPLCDGSHNRIE